MCGTFVVTTGLATVGHHLEAASPADPWIDPALAKDWLERWQKDILGEARSRACDRENGEGLGWLVSPVLNGFYYGFLYTRDPQWIEHLVDWTDAIVVRAVREPDGFKGWPQGNGSGGESKEYKADSLLGEAMFLKPVVSLAHTILTSPELKAKWGAKAEAYLELAKDIFRKWDSRGCWRETEDGGVWIVPGWGIDLTSPGRWSAGYAQWKTEGFTNPANKLNEISLWMLAMHNATGDRVYRERAEKWFRVMKKRMRNRGNSSHLVWNYWDPAGPWDYREDGRPRHWVGVHPNGGYYWIDVMAITAAFEHGLVFTKTDIDALTATNRDFMWNQTLKGAKFQRIDGGESDARWKNSPGVLWSALVPYDAVLRGVFVANHKPDSWGGMAETPWFLWRSKGA
jgi:hypothetical protein